MRKLYFLLHSFFPWPYQQDKLEVYPASFGIPNVNDVTFNYIRKPKDVVWAYGLGDLDQYIWDQVYTGASAITPSTGSQDFELSDNFQTEVIAASIRNPIHFKECAKYGCDVATVPYKILLQLFEHPLTDKGIQFFKDDWKKVSERKN